MSDNTQTQPKADEKKFVSFSDFQKERIEASNGGGSDPFNFSEVVKTSTTTEPVKDLEKVDQEQPKPDTQEAKKPDDGAKEKVEPSVEDKDSDRKAGQKPGDLSPAMKRRLAREKRKYTRLQGENKELAARLEALEKDVSSKKDAAPAEETKTENKRVVKDGKVVFTSVDEYREALAKNEIDQPPMPEIDDYQSKDVSEADAEKMWQEDVDAWVEDNPFPHDPMNHNTAEIVKVKNAEVKEKDKKKSPEPMLDENEYRKSLFQDLDELIDEGEKPDETRESLIEGLKSEKIFLSDQMVEFILENDDGLKLVQEFIKRPVQSRKIVKERNTDKHAEMLKNLLKNINNRKSKEKKSQEIPDQTVLRGDAGSNSISDALYEASDFSSYNKARNRQGGLKDKSRFAW